MDNLLFITISKFEISTTISIKVRIYFKPFSASYIRKGFFTPSVFVRYFNNKSNNYCYFYFTLNVNYLFLKTYISSIRTQNEQLTEGIT